MNKKILAFVYHTKIEKILILKSLPHPEHGSGGWFTVTGSIEDGETQEEAAIREIKEETNLDVKEVFDLNWGSIYNWFNQDHEERNLIAFINSDRNIKLDIQEVVDYRWLDLEKFVKKIKWDDNKKVLIKVLKKAIKKEKYFKNFKLKDYR